MKHTAGEKVFLSINNVFLFLLALSCLVPLLYTISMSLSSAYAIDSGFVYIWPVEINFDAYRLLFANSRILASIYHSLVITSVGTFLSMIGTIVAAYPLSRKYLIGRRNITMFMIFTMLFSGGAIPGYLLIKNLGMMNSYWALWIPGLISTFNMLVMKTSFESVPEELEEAARIDGCSEWRILVQIFLPLSKPILATFTLFYGVSYWNAFYPLLVFITDSNKYNLAVLVQQMVQNQEYLQQLTGHAIELENNVPPVPESLKSAAVMVLVVPMLLVYPFVQKYFVKGALLGAVKG
jgi:putative aldouronate transport system permease protein